MSQSPLFYRTDTMVHSGKLSKLLSSTAPFRKGLQIFKRKGLQSSLLSVSLPQAHIAPFSSCSVQPKRTSHSHKAQNNQLLKRQRMGGYKKKKRKNRATVSGCVGSRRPNCQNFPTFGSCGPKGLGGSSPTEMAAW